MASTALVFMMVPGIALVIAYGMLESRQALLSGAMGDFVHQCFAAALFLLFVGAAIRSVHSPFAPTLRRSGTTVKGARVVGFCSLAVAVIFAFDMVLLQGATTLGTSLDIALVQSISNVLVISVLLFVSSLGVTRLIVLWAKGGPEHGSSPMFCYLSGVPRERKAIASRRSLLKK